jgi:hypothetical protein
MTGYEKFLVRHMSAERRRQLFWFCVYCGRPCIGQVCPAHRDLPEVDPFYGPTRFGLERVAA